MSQRRHFLMMTCLMVLILMIPFFNTKKFQCHPARKRKKKLKEKSKQKEQESGGGELSLLVMDSDDETGHFDYKEIVKRESKSKKKQKKLEKKLGKVGQPENDFQLDLEDNRFAAVFQNSDFNVDPSHPSF